MLPASLVTSLTSKADIGLENAIPLRQRTTTSGVRYGCASAAPSVQPDITLLDKIRTEANIFVPEGSLKWIVTEPQPGQFDFLQGDSIAVFARRNGMLVHGHTLVWHAAIPTWVSQLVAPASARMALGRHIGTLVSRYKGLIWAWDVVNEAIEPDDGIDYGYRNSPWYHCLGADYIDLAFRLARDADSKPPLCLSEYGLEYQTLASKRRRSALLSLLRHLRTQGTPIDCLALQSHLSADQVLDQDGLTSFLRQVVALGYRLAITELDVNDAKIPGTIEARDRIVEAHVSDYLDLVFSVARPISIATWGLSDRYTWLRQYYSRDDGTALRPLPLDVNLRRKPMWSALARFISAP